MSDLAGSRGAVALGALVGWVAVTAPWALLLTVVVGRLNGLPPGDLPALFGFWFIGYLLVLLPGLALGVTLAALRPSTASFWRAAALCAVCSATFLVCVNLFFRWVPVVRLVRGLILPVGIAGLLVLVLAALALVLAGERVSRPAAAGRRLGSAGLLAILTVVLLAGGHAL